MSHKKRQSQVEWIIPAVEKLRNEALSLADQHIGTLNRMGTLENYSASNLLHYLAVRQHDVRRLQVELSALGLSSLGRMEAHTLATLNAVLVALHSLAGRAQPQHAPDPPVDFVTGPLILRERTQMLLGMPSGKRSVRIMVTMPSEAAASYRLVRELLGAGMDVMRINCAHDGPDAWLAMIENLRRAERKLGRPCKVYADLAGPKLRTGAIEPIGRILKVRPVRNLRGEVVEPVRVRFIPDAGQLADTLTVPCQIPLDAAVLSQAEVGDLLTFADARGRKRVLKIVDKNANGCVAESDHTSYLETGAIARLLRGEDEIASGALGLLPELEPPIPLKLGDQLVLTPSSILGRAAILGERGQVVAPA